MDITAVLDRLTSARTCDASELGITDADLKELRLTKDNPDDLRDRFIDLTDLTVSDNPITNEGLRWLAPLHKLQNFNISRTKVDDEGMKLLAMFPGLKSLAFGDMIVTDTGLANLITASPGLEELEFGGVNITDEGLKAHIPRLTGLRCLIIYEGAHTDDGLAELQRLCPELTILG